MAVTDYLRGTGTKADPYIIHNAAAFIAFLSTTAPCFMTAAYFEVIADIDCGGYGAKYNFNYPNFSAKVNGNGHIIKGFLLNGLHSWYLTGSGGFKNIHLDADFGLGIMSWNSTTFGYLQDVMFTSRGRRVFSYSGTLSGVNNGSNMSNVVINSSGVPFDRDDTSTYKLPESVYILTDAALTGYANAIKLSGTMRFDKTKYPTLSQEKWILDGVSFPRLIPNQRVDLTHKFAVKGKTSVGGSGKKRNIAVFVAATLGSSIKKESDSFGNYVIDLGDIYDPVIVTHYDDYGFPFIAGGTYAIGDLIHPAVANGYVYECTTPGISASIEPQTWPTSGALITGAAIFTPRPVYKPESHLVQPVKIDLLTGLPV